MGRWICLGAGALIALWCWLLYLIVAGSYLGPVFGSRSWHWFGATAVVALGIPVLAGTWLARPRAGFHKAVWFTATTGVISLLFVVAFCGAAPGRTASLLRLHGQWPFEQTCGKTSKSTLSRLGSDLVAMWANLLERPAPKVQARPSSRRIGSAPPTWEILPRGVQPVKNPPASRPAKGLGPRSGVRVTQRDGAVALTAVAQHGTRQEPLGLMLDTGATLTAMSREGARRLGVRLPAAPVTVRLQTATGPAVFPLLLLDRLRIGQAEVRHLTVALCDACSPPGLSGLLGLNFTRHFVLSVDQQRRRLTLQPHPSDRNRITDVEPFLRITTVTGRTLGRRIEVTGNVENRAPRAVLGLELSAELLDDESRVVSRLTTRLKSIPAGQTRAFTITGRTPPRLVKYQLVPTHAIWAL